MDNLDIVPGIRIGRYHLGMSFNKITSILKKQGNDYEVKKLYDCTKIETNNMSFWLYNDKVTQILVFGDYKGTLFNCIGIGSRLSEVKKEIGSWKEGEYDISPIYVLENIPGVCFELCDDDEWDEDSAPIECISIYSP